MSKILKVLALVSVLLLASFSFLFYRDIVWSPNRAYADSCVPRNIEIVEKTKTTVSIEWRTGDSCISYIRYGEKMDAIHSMVVDANGMNQHKDHKAEITNLSPEQTYFFVVVSDDIVYGYNKTPLIFETESL